MKIIRRPKGPVHFEISQLNRARRDAFERAGKPDAERDRSFRQIILSIPAGKVTTYGRVAAAAGYPRLHRSVARLLRTDPPDQLPWHRVVGAGGHIKLPGAAAKEQRARLTMEGVQFRGQRIDMDQCEYSIRPWTIPD